MAGISEERLEKYIAYHIDTTGEVLLNDQELLEYKRLLRCFELMSDRYPDSDIVFILAKEFDVHKEVARKIIRQTQFVFSKRPEYKKEFYRSLLIEYYMQALKMAFDKKEPEAVFSGLDKLGKLLGFDKQEGIDPESLRPHNYMLVVNGNLKIDLNKMQSLNAAEREELMKTFGEKIEEVQFEMINHAGTKTADENFTS